MILTPREKMIFKEFIQRGYLKFEDFIRNYATEHTAREKIKRLLMIGALQEGPYFRLMISEEAKKLL